MTRSNSILVVEDNALNQKLLVRFLSARGFRVQVAQNTTEAEQVLRQDPPGLVLMDVSLPGEDGLSFVRRLRAGAVEDCRNLPVVAVTAHALLADRERALAAGCQEHLTKPVDLKQVESVARRYLEEVTP